MVTLFSLTLHLTLTIQEKKRITNCIGVKRSEFIKTINMLFLSHMILSLQDAKFKFPTTAGYFAAFCIIKIDILVHSLTVLQ